MVGVDRPAQSPILNALGQYATGYRNQHQRNQQRSHDAISLPLPNWREQLRAARWPFYC
jgi:hypothetical protein